MGSNIGLVSDAIDYYDLLNKSGLLLMVVFQKTFGSLDWHFLFKTFKTFSTLVLILCRTILCHRGCNFSLRADKPFICL